MWSSLIFNLLLTLGGVEGDKNVADVRMLKAKAKAKGISNDVPDVIDVYETEYSYMFMNYFGLDSIFF